ncbi:MAG TPA: hypothetical protein VJM46_02915 [Candidatus Saccharimonadales bacterium]|nr:hypothetical protein [Candidatus Saccharimonadales bacterium]
MASKQETAVKSAVTREKKKGIVREEKHFLWFLIAIILLLLYLLWAQSNGWWPFAQPRLGSAFYTNVSAAGPDQPAAATTESSGTDGSNGSNGSTGTSGSTGNTGNSGGGSNNGGGNNNGGGGSTTPPPATASSGLADLAANLNIGNTKEQITARANGLGPNCAVIVNADGLNVGKQEVCTYTEGDKIITVTYLNDRVISASKSGF